MIDIVEYKINEFIGDAILKLLVCELIIPKKRGFDKFHKKRLIKQVNELCSNDYLSIVAQEIGLEPHPDDEIIKQSPYRPIKIYANAYEAIVYDIYTNQGHEACKEFIKNTLIK